MKVHYTNFQRYNKILLSLLLGYGITSDGKIIFVNASTCDINYYPHNPPIVFDITLPKGKTKADYL